jgi:hypothetical protein
MADTDAAREILNGLVFLANEAQRAGLPVVMRRIAAAIDDVAKWMDENAENSDLPLGASLAARPKHARDFGGAGPTKFFS